MFLGFVALTIHYMSVAGHAAANPNVADQGLDHGAACLQHIGPVLH